MSLREKVINGFTHTYIENEEKIVRNLLQTGRLEKEEWKEIAEELGQKADLYTKGDLKPKEYIKARRGIVREFSRSKEEKKKGLTREEAEKMYEEIKEEQRATLKNAYLNSGFSTLTVMAKTLAARVKFITARLKNI